MKAKRMTDGWARLLAGLGVWLAGTLGTSGADVDFSGAVLLQDAEMASVRADTLDRWAAPDGRMHFAFMQEARDRAVWMGGNRDRRGLEVRALGMPVYEAQAAFRPDGDLASLELVLFSRGDVVQAGGAGDATVEAAVHDEKAFRTLCARVNGQLEAALGKAAQHRTQRPVRNHEQRQFRWAAPQGAVVLSLGRTEEHGAFRGEYIRVKVLPAARTGAGAAGTAGAGFPLPAPSRAVPAAGHDSGRITAKKGSLAEHVVREEGGAVYVGNLPMVDQGDKGYCAVATLERLIRYYGGEASQHELAQLFNTADGGGTSIRLDRFVADDVCRKFHLKQETLRVPPPPAEKILKRYNAAAARKIEVGRRATAEDIQAALAGADAETLAAAVRTFPEYRDFMQTVRRWTEKGIPLVWLVPGHVRLLTGFDEAPGDIFYSDSWGAGHERDRMPGAEALLITVACFAVHP